MLTFLGDSSMYMLTREERKLISINRHLQEIDDVTGWRDSKIATLQHTVRILESREEKVKTILLEEANRLREIANTLWDVAGPQGPVK